MNKELQTIYIPVSVKDRLPDNNFGVHVLVKNGIDIDSYNALAKEWTVTYDRKDNEVTHWLESQQRILLTAEEWESVQKCASVLQEIAEADNMELLVSHYNKAKQALSQLNKSI